MNIQVMALYSMGFLLSEEVFFGMSIVVVWQWYSDNKLERAKNTHKYCRCCCFIIAPYIYNSRVLNIYFF